MPRPVALGHEPRVAELVERALLEADRERPQRLARLLRRERGERGRVDAAREQHAHRDVAHEVGPDGVGEAGAQLLHELGLVVAAQAVTRSKYAEV